MDQQSNVEGAGAALEGEPTSDQVQLSEVAVATAIKPFDFEAHASAAVANYLPVQLLYRDLGAAAARILMECLRKNEVKISSVEHRAKEPESFRRKAATPSEVDPNAPKYTDPLRDITDLAGVRVITFFPNSVQKVDQIISKEFEIREKSDKSEELVEEERFGYQSVHYLVQLRSGRTQLAEYSDFADRIVEIQVRTILQHAWAEIEHDIQYRSSILIPKEIRRRFMQLAGVLEIADREFQAIDQQNRELAATASEKVSSGDLSGVEITPQALKQFLDGRLGSDDRIADWSYAWATTMLRKLGFVDLRQIETAIRSYNDDQLSHIVSASRQGQLSRFEIMLLAALGETFIERHPSAGHDWFKVPHEWSLERLREKGIPVSSYDPRKDIHFVDEL